MAVASGLFSSRTGGAAVASGPLSRAAVDVGIKTCVGADTDTAVTGFVGVAVGNGKHVPCPLRYTERKIEVL